jgi:hypothetical protein
MDDRLDLAPPHVEKALELGELRGLVIELPDEHLNQRWIIRHEIADFCG